MPPPRVPKGCRYFRREFLNREGWYLGAHILATVAKEPNYGRVTIADCDRAIRLELDGEDKGQMRNSLYKLDVLITTLIAVRQELTDGYAAHRKAQAKRERRQRTRRS